MAPASGKSDSSTARGVALRMRPDLSIHPQQVGQQRYWVVKDPVALAYFHLRDEEHAILQMLDGRTSLAEIKRRFEQAFAPLQLTVERLHAFLFRLHRCGLVLSEAVGQGSQLLIRHNRRRRLDRIRSITGVLAIRFRGIDPEPLLRRLYPKCRWLFSWWVLAGGMALVLAAAGLVAVQFDVWQSKLPDFREFFNARNVVWLAAALAVAKILHELGHALTCKHFGGECHEMGVMFLVFTPCLYCNVSDSWMLKSKWHRMAVTAAGIFVEIVLAAVCTFLWWFSEPGLLNTLCLNVMFVCSVSTVLFNGNPLLRYDGYFILSDLVAVPNLAQQAKALVSRGLARALLGAETPDDRALPEQRRGLLAIYGVASTLYRWFVVIAILWFCHKILKEYRLELLAQLMTLVVIVGLLMVPVWNVVAFLRNPAWQRRIKRGRALLSGVVLLAVVAGICTVPLPFRVTAPVVLEPRNAHYRYVSVPGTLVWSVSPGKRVEQGEILAQLENLDVRVQVQELDNQYNELDLRVKNLEQLKGLDDRSAAESSASSQIPAAEKARDDVQERLQQRERDQDRLILRAPAGGTVLPPPSLAPPRYSPDRLETWWGHPLQPQNLGCYLDTGTLFCLVGDPSRLEAVLVIDQADRNFVRTGQRVRIQLDEAPGEILPGTIAEIAENDLKVVPRELAGGGDLLTRTDQRGIRRPLETSYQVRVRLDDHDHRLLVGARGRAKILVDAQPLGQRFYRYLKRTFNFSL
ncbi:MAG TPA: HlyD family efflux transporter periplasmic adaptor subunit [Thermoguttaceae bacterium]|nr:HlyD family efflux transporter periplasmic adaptor subunit [Thermoguttaceae bacterium]